mmetsp:Transcript_46110/g.107244  ORF Transcript_46110/g.107244 Transcript_46110/m.107244 type:complete len:228 (-) Transcript_46110:3888-4571(-)
MCLAISNNHISISAVASSLARPVAVTKSFLSMARFRELDLGISAPDCGNLLIPTSFLSSQPSRPATTIPCSAFGSIFTCNPTATPQSNFKHCSSVSFVVPASRRQMSNIQLSMNVPMVSKNLSFILPTFFIACSPTLSIAKNVAEWRVFPLGKSLASWRTMENGILSFRISAIRLSLSSDRRLISSSLSFFTSFTLLSMSCTSRIMCTSSGFNTSLMNNAIVSTRGS